MPRPHIAVSPDQAVALDAEAPVGDVARQLAAVSDRLLDGMRTTLTQGAFLAWVAGSMRVRRVCEVGTFTGFATLCLAEGAPGASIDTFEVHAPWVQVARSYWEAAGVADRITAHLKPVQDWTPDGPPFDLVFLDGEKAQYIDYYEHLLPHLTPAGVLVADDTMWPENAGMVRVAGEEDGIRAFNAHVQDDPRVTAVRLPLVNGMTMVRKTCGS